jgi:SAM-dependent methyltransferase
MKKITRELIGPILARHATEKKVLNIGAGGEAYREYFPNQTTLDIDRGRNPDVVGDVHALPFPEEHFEVVLSTAMLEHVLDPKKAVSEMRRVLKTGGKLILTTAFVFPTHSREDYWRFTEAGMRELFKDFTIEEIVPDSRPFETVAILLQRIMFQTVMRGNKLSKLLVLIFVYLVRYLDPLIKKQYADIARKHGVQNFMPAGYSIVCRK